MVVVGKETLTAAKREWVDKQVQLVHQSVGEQRSNEALRLANGQCGWRRTVRKGISGLQPTWAWGAWTCPDSG